MRQRASVLVLLFALLWQAVAVAGQVMDVGRAEDLAHASLHWEHESHHHHEDGSYHEEDSVDGAVHLLTDGSFHNIALLQWALPDLPMLDSALPAMVSEAAGSPPFLGSLRRPPRSHA